MPDSPQHLLPSNATPFERSLSLSTDSLTRLGGLSDALLDFKSNPADALLPWLIWEYGLSELLVYLPNSRIAIRDGIRWQRLRGTPAALSTALAWVGATALAEQEPPGVHFADFMLNPGRVLDSAAEIGNIIALARLSAPARARLTRIFYGHDLRRMMLDESRMGDALLSDYSGVLGPDGITRLSFGRVRKFAHPQLPVETIAARESVRFGVARLLDRYLLDFARLGDASHARNEEILHSHLFALANALGVRIPQTVLPERRFCRAMVVPGEGTPLGDTNACTPRFVWQESGETFRTGMTGLSESTHRLRRAEVTERLEAERFTALSAPDILLRHSAARVKTARVYARADQALSVMRLGEFMRISDTGWRLSEHVATCAPDAVYAIRPSRHAEITAASPAPGFAPSPGNLQRLLMRQASNGAVAALPSRTALAAQSAAWRGQTWTGVRWPPSRWPDTRELMTSTHTTTGA